MSAYLDASVLIPRFVEEATSETVRCYMRTHQPELLVGDFAAAEVADALSRLVRMRLLQGVDAAARLADFEVWRAATTSPVDIAAADMRLAYAYVKRFELKLRAPNALHLAIARRLDATLVTLDGGLAEAATSLGIAVAVPGADSAPDPR